VASQVVCPLGHSCGKRAGEDTPRSAQPREEGCHASQSQLDLVDRRQRPDGALELVDPKDIMFGEVTGAAEPHGEAFVEPLTMVISQCQVMLMVSLARAPRADRLHETSSR
jgi:hypothetical protein